MKYNVDVSKIRVGQLFKNERELARFLGYPETKQQKVRKKQYADIGRYLAYKSTDNPKKKREIRIIEIKEKPDLKVDGRRQNGRKGKYIDLLKPLILAKGSFQASYADLVREFFDITETPRAEEYSELYDYIFLLYSTAKARIRTALNSLEKESISFKWSEDNIYKIDTGDRNALLVGREKASPVECRAIRNIEDSCRKKALYDYNEKLRSRGEKEVQELPNTILYGKAMRERCSVEVENTLGIKYIRLVECNTDVKGLQQSANVEEYKYQLHDLLGRYLLHALKTQTTHVDGERIKRFELSYNLLDYHNSLFPDYKWESPAAEAFRA